MYKTYEFDATIECSYGEFWFNVDKEDFIKIMGIEEYKKQLDLDDDDDDDFRIEPYALFKNPNKKHKITLTIEELE